MTPALRAAVAALVSAALLVATYVVMLGILFGWFAA